MGNLGIFILKNVLVSTSNNPEMRARVLLGVSDLNRLRVVMDFEKKRVRFGVGPNHEKWVNMRPQIREVRKILNREIYPTNQYNSTPFK